MKKASILLIQSTLKEFVSAIEASDFDRCVGLTARGETPGGLEMTQGKSNIFFPTGTYDNKNTDQIIAGWYFSSKPTGLSSSVRKSDEIEQGKCARLEGDIDHQVKQGVVGAGPTGDSGMSRFCYSVNGPLTPHCFTIKSG